MTMDSEKLGNVANEEKAEVKVEKAVKEPKVKKEKAPKAPKEPKVKKEKVAKVSKEKKPALKLERQVEYVKFEDGYKVTVCFLKAEKELVPIYAFGRVGKKEERTGFSLRGIRALEKFAGSRNKDEIMKAFNDREKVNGITVKWSEVVKKKA